MPGGVLWTLLCGATLLAVAASRRRVPIGATPEPGEEEEDDPNGHTGRSARWVAATQVHRGRAAEHPGDIPAAGWRDIVTRVFHEFHEDRVLSVAAGVTFYTLLSLAPALAALVSCYGLIADANTINEHLASLQGTLPSAAIDIVGEQIKRIAAKSGGSLGLTFFTSLTLSLWSANAAMKAMFDALNVVYDEQEKRNFFWLNLRSLAFTVGGLVFIIAALSAIVVLPVVFNIVGLGDGAWALALLRWPALLIVLLASLTLLYRYGPSRAPARWRWVGAGGAIAGLLWLVASMLFSWYVARFGTYNETYGSLGAVIAFMTWIWISATIVLVGGEINSEMERQTARDSTAGRDKPLGLRKARAADTLGAAA